MEKILKEIRTERYRQDEKWGGSKHDDKHTMVDWLRFIDQRMTLLCTGLWGAPKRKLMIQIAALCVAAIQSHDRKDESASTVGCDSRSVQP